MTRIIIAGGGGFGLELYGYLQQDLASGRLGGHTLAGVLDDGADCELLRKTPDANYLGPIRDYRPQAEDRIAIALGSVAGRRAVAAGLVERGARLFTYVHGTAWIAASARLGEGSLVCPNSIVNAVAELEGNVLVNVYCSVGHGSRIGAHSVLSPYCSLSGDSSLGDWASDDNKNGAPDAAEVASLLYFPTQGEWVAGGKLTDAFNKTYEDLVTASKAPPPGDERQQKLLGELDAASSVLVRTPLAGMNEVDQKFVAHMVKASQLIDKLYAIQSGVDPLAAKVPADAPSQSVFRGNWGPGCKTPTFEKDPACTAIPGVTEVAVDVYPAALQSDKEFCKKIEEAENKKELTQPFAVVREEGGKLVAKNGAVVPGLRRKTQTTARKNNAPSTDQIAMRKAMPKYNSQPMRLGIAEGVVSSMTA